MKYITYSEILDRVANLAGFDASNLTEVDEKFIKSFLGSAIRKIWDAINWTELTLVESFAVDANGVVTDATGKLDDALVYGVWNQNVLDITLTSIARKYAHFITNNGVFVPEAKSKTVYIQYRQSCPALSFTRLWTATSYATGSIVVYGDPLNFWKSNASTVAGEVPGVSNKWELVKIPYRFAEFLTRKIYSDYLRTQGQNELAQLEQTFAEDAIVQEIDRLQHQQQQYVAESTMSHAIWQNRN